MVADAAVNGVGLVDQTLRDGHQFLGRVLIVQIEIFVQWEAVIIHAP